MVFPRPLLAVPNVTYLVPDRLHELGIKGLLLDLDNTLMLPHGVQGHGALTDDVRDWLSQVRDADIQLVCVTNCKNAAYCHAVEELLGFPVIHKAQKPFGSGLKLALRYLDVSPRQVAVVGDRPTTDGWGAAWLGSPYIQTAPLRTDEPALYHVLRWLERRLIGRPRLLMV